MKESIWVGAARAEDRPGLVGRKEADAVVIGGGLAGVLTARYLADGGGKVVLLEGALLGDGQTGGTTAKVTAQHGAMYAKLIAQSGLTAATQYAQANQWAVEEYPALIDRLGIQCAWESGPAYLYATGDGEALKGEAEAQRTVGLASTFTTQTELPFPVKGAVRLENQGRFHPLELLYGAAKGLTVYEHSPVRRVEEGQVTTDGGVVVAKHIVFATHFPFVNAPGYYFARMHQERSYVLALEGAGAMEGMYLGTDGQKLSFRPAGQYLLLGGGGHRTGDNQEGGKYGGLVASAKRFWPDCAVARRWSAQDCVTLDGIPYIGRFSANRPNWYVATGFGKWGMTSSLAAARIISGLVAGNEAPWGAVFSPQRKLNVAAMGSLGKDGARSAGGLALGVCAGGRRCSHLGCRTNWNPDEESWDCPCHGSRFNRQGGLLDGPAQKDV